MSSESIISRLSNEAEFQENKDLLKASLPKWPAMVVVGEPVTKDQAKEILIRTASMHFSTNDHNFALQLYKYLNIKCKEELYPWPESEQLHKVEEELGCFTNKIDYLRNSRIVSSWIGGPHGWCNWDGNIFTNNYNIGKWPSCEQVYSEWLIISEAFPYLKLICQLFSGETSEEDTKPIIEYVVSNGCVKACNPGKLIRASMNENLFVAMMLGRDRERGCTLEIFKDAIEHTRKVMKEKRKQNEKSIAGN